VKDASGQISGSFDVPSQNATGVPFSSVTSEKDSFICVLQAPPVRVSLSRTNDTTLTGSWVQGAASPPLVLHRGLNGFSGAAAGPVKHPQTPVPPYPYQSDSVEYDNADHSVHFGATLTYPKTGGPFPAMVMITGSGIQDRDETLFGQKPFAVIADYLTRRGYAVLRVDDRGAGLTRGGVRFPTSGDFARDVETGLQYLKTRKEINPAKMGLVGHSEGAMIAPMVAARNKDVSFIILLASPAIGGYATVLRQTMDLSKYANPDPRYPDYSVHLEQLLLDNAKAAKDSSDFITRFYAGYKTWTDSVADSVKQRFPTIFLSEADFKGYFGAQTKLFLNPWYIFWLDYMPVNDFRHVTCPVLAMNGDKDIQVAYKANLDLINKTLTQAGNRHFETKVMPGLNHLFQHCRTCVLNEYGKLEETFAPEALQTMGDWLDANVGH